MIGALLHWLWLNVFGNLIASMIWGVPAAIAVLRKMERQHKERMAELKKARQALQSPLN